MSLWIRSEQGLLNHPKTLLLCELTKLEKDVVIGRLHRLWWWCLDYAFDGNLRKFDAPTIEAACGLPLPGLVVAGFVDVRPYRRIHGWWDYASNYLKVKYKHQPEKWRQIETAYYTDPNTIPKTHPKGRSKDVDVQTYSTNNTNRQDVQTYTKSTESLALSKSGETTDEKEFQKLLEMTGRKKGG